jgi:hypothetical protein
VVVSSASALPAAEYERVALSQASGDSLSDASNQAATLQLPPARVERITTELRESVARDAELWAGVLRAWLAEEEKA